MSPRSAAAAATELTAEFEKCFPGGPVIQVELRLPADAFATVLPVPGSGKSTTLRCLAGLDRPERGTIRVGNEIWFDAARGIFPAAAPPDRIPVPGLRPLPPSGGSPEPRLRPEQGRGAGAAAAHRGDHDAARVGRSRRPLSEAVVRRTAATRRAGARAGLSAASAPARRAAVRARRSYPRAFAAAAPALARRVANLDDL